MIEPNCDMPWDIYLDWLQDQGYEDLREILIGSVIPCWAIYSHVNVGNGGMDEFYYSYSPLRDNQLLIGDSYCGSVGQGYGLDCYYHLDEEQFYIAESGGIPQRENRGDGVDREGEDGNGVGNMI